MLHRLGLLLLLSLFLLVATQLYFAFGNRVYLSQFHSNAKVDVAQPIYNPDPRPDFEGYDGSLATYVKERFEAFRQLLVDPRWDYEKRSEDLSLPHGTCAKFFSGLYGELNRAKLRYQKYHITTEDLAAIEVEEGRVRAGVKNGKLSVLETNLATEISRLKAYSVLESLHEAIKHSPEDIPDVEFVFSVHLEVKDITQPLFVFDRREQDGNVWLMPDVGVLFGVSPPLMSTVRPEDSSQDLRKHSPRVSKSSEPSAPVWIEDVVADIDRIELTTPFEEKRDFLVGTWRMGTESQTTEFESLAQVTYGKKWAANANETMESTLAGFDAPRLEAMSSNDELSPITQSRPVAVSEICRYKYMAYVASAKNPTTAGPLLCSSVLFLALPEWINLYHGVILGDLRTPEAGVNDNPVVQHWRAKGAGSQNVVVVRKDWKDLDAKISGLLENSHVAEQISKNAAVDFRRKYLTKAARNCYWRELLRSYRSVAVEPDEWVDVSVADGNGHLPGLRKAVPWKTYLTLNEDAQASLKKSGWI